ncbi:tetratricopeptide repeat-containing sensor histidine kinase [Phocaeicola sp.]
MRKGAYILFIITILFSSPFHAEDRNTQHLSTLQHLMDNNMAFDSITPIDSVIAWGQQISPMLEKEKQTELFFRIRQLMVYLYTLNGNIGEAIDEAWQMYGKAEAMNNNLGLALSSRAIGDAYYCSNMMNEAIDSYKEAIHYPLTASENKYFRDMTILKLIALLIKEDRMEEAQQYRSILPDPESANIQIVLQFLTHATDVIFYIKREELQRANDSFLKARQIYETDKQPFLYANFHYIQGQHNEATGKYQEALQSYDNILNNVCYKMRSIIYLQVAYAKANLLIKMGNKKGAANLYEEINHITDSVVAPGYAHRINNLRASYQENRIKIENKTELNQILIEGLVIGIVILFAITYLTVHIRKQNKEIAESKIRLEQSRLNAENAIHTKSLFLSNMSHEIRTPLSAISGFSSLLTEQELDEETRRQCGEVIQRNSDLLLKLINDVIDLSNLGAGNINFHFNNHDAIDICRNVIETVDKVKQTQAEVFFKTSLDSLELYTDDSRLQQLLINLLINATKFTPKGSITLELELQSENTALFSVTDTGCGISPEQQNKIFNRFEKLNEGAQGTGLGLSICQLIIEHIGGRIWIDSDYTSGCRFCFTHPISPVKEKEKGGQA